MNNDETHIYIEKIEIKNFRAFSEKDKVYTIELGKHITCISGHNGIGKSTILAMLSNCGELKASDGKLLNGDQFRGEYSEIIKHDKFDTSGEKCSIYFSGNLPKEDSKGDPYPQKLDFRALKQQGGERYRLIPKKIDDIREKESKIEWPVYYLGLSRLYPVGESKNVETKRIKMPDSIRMSFFDTYNHILNMQEGSTESEFLSPSDAKKKKGVGISTDKYGSLSNSSGQDNLGQILLAVFSFEQLKKDLENNNCFYDGGMLLVDEIDATLHPAAQNKLFKFLYNKSKELKLQIVFTTHSLSLLEYVSKTHELCEKNKSLIIQYLTNSRGKIEIRKNPEINTIKNDLLITYSKIIEMPKIDVITEDKVARWLLKNIIEQKQLSLSLNYLDCNFGYNEISKLIVGSEIFKNCLVIFDPDISQDNRKNTVQKVIEDNTFFTLDKPSLCNHRKRCLLILPGGEPIEKLIWDYIKNSPENHDMYHNEKMESRSITKRSLTENTPRGNMQDLNNQKIWFDDNIDVCNIIVKYWIRDNNQYIDDFIQDLKFEYNKIASQFGLKNID